MQVIRIRVFGGIHFNHKGGLGVWMTKDGVHAESFLEPFECFMSGSQTLARVQLFFHTSFQ